MKEVLIKTTISSANFWCTLVTRIEEVLRIVVMGGKFFHVMVPLEDIVEFMNANMVRIRVLVCQV